MPACEMSDDCHQPVTHIGDKGYVYCATCAMRRRSYGKMRPAELRRIERGEPLARY